MQDRVNPGRAMPAAMCRMDLPDLGKQGAIGRLARTFGPVTPGIYRAFAPPITSHKARTLNVSRRSSMRRNFLPALPGRCAAFFLKSPAPCAGAGSCAADGRFRPPDPHRQAGLPPAYLSAAAIPLSDDHRHPARSAASFIEAALPSSRTIWLNGRPLLVSNPPDSRLNSSVN
jgi:hypothetical protein